MGAVMAISANASAFDIFEGTMLSDNWQAGSIQHGGTGNSRIQQHNAYGPGQHMDQYGQNVTIQPRYGSGAGSNTFNRIERHNAYGPDIHMDQYGRPATVQPQYGGMGSGISPW